MIGQVFMNPFTREPHYCVKVGKSINFYNRMKDYETHSPMVWKIDFQLCPDRRIMNECEIKYQMILQDCSLSHFGNTEWYEVTTENYKAICKNGFVYFDELQIEFIN